MGRMGTVVARQRKDGTMGYTARLRIQRDGKTHVENKTFDRQAMAHTWIKRREAELAEPGALDRPADPQLAEVIDRYIAESKQDMGRTKAQVLRTIKADRLGG